MDEEQFTFKVRVIYYCDSIIILRICVSTITHINAKFGIGEERNIMYISTYYKYVEINPLGNFIDGDLVIQGKSVNSNYGPIICFIEYSMDSSDYHHEVVIMPWAMIFEPDIDQSFSIPIALGSDFNINRVATLRILIYVDELQKISYDTEREDYKFNPDSHICAWEYTSIKKNRIKSYDSFDNYDTIEIKKSSSSDKHIRALSKDGADLNLRNEVEEAERKLEVIDTILTHPEPELHVHEDAELALDVTDGNVLLFERDDNIHSNITQSGHTKSQYEYIESIRIASNYDEVSVLQSEGYELSVVQFSPDSELIFVNQSYLFNFFVMAKKAVISPGNQHNIPIVAIEDVLWIRHMKVEGMNENDKPELDGYEVFHEFDLMEVSRKQSLDEEGIEESLPFDFQVYLAVKVGSTPTFSSMKMALAPLTCSMDRVNSFLSNQSQFIIAPEELSSLLDATSVGLLFELFGFEKEASHGVFDSIIHSKGKSSGVVKDVILQEITEHVVVNNSDMENDEDVTGFLSSNDGNIAKVGVDSQMDENFSQENDLENSESEEEEEMREVDPQIQLEHDDEEFDSFEEQFLEIKAQHELLVDENIELQKKAALFIAREKIKQLQSLAMPSTLNSSSSHNVNNLVSIPSSGAISNISSNTSNQNQIQSIQLTSSLSSGTTQHQQIKSAYDLAIETFKESEAMKETMIEKFKQYEINLKLLRDMKLKMDKQESKFQQLGSALQQRLNEKEMQATEINEKFKAFKR